MPLCRAGIKLVSQSEVQCQPRLHAPVVLNVPTEILIRETITIHRGRLARAKRAWNTGQEFCKAAKVINSSGAVALLLDVEHLFKKAAELQRMQATRIRYIVGDFAQIPRPDAR